MPLVTSLCDARQEGHVLDGLGAMGVAQMQQRMVTAVPPVLLEWSGSVAKDMWFDCVISMLNNQCKCEYNSRQVSPGQCFCSLRMLGRHKKSNEWF
jgi:hypothetical protein